MTESSFIILSIVPRQRASIRDWILYRPHERSRKRRLAERSENQDPHPSQQEQGSQDEALHKDNGSGGREALCDATPLCLNSDGQ